MGLTDDEAESIVEILGRAPNELELAMFGVMWSEHCSYKSSRVHLRRLPTHGEGVMVGPGENAGVIDAGNGVAIAIRIESHNHPSAIEPYQGAATGVGGIIRDIFTMGARPIALMDPLRLGPLDDSRSRWLLDGIVRGVAGYGNAVGVPTVGGEVVFDSCYAGNPLVNVLCVGLLPHGRLVLARASGAGNLAVLLGSATGRDGIGGVSVLASAELGSGSEQKRPSVQVADPFEEKRLIEACLELLERGLVVGIQDLGGAGLTCATSETAAKAGMGMDVDVSAVPLREAGMVAAEVMTSESQERMLAIVEPGSFDEVQAIADRWQVRASVVGVVTEPVDGVGRLRIFDRMGGEVLADVPAASLSDDAPLYDRPRARPEGLDDRRADDPGALAAPTSCGEDLLRLVADPAWIYRQYDHQLFLNTVAGPGGDAALLRLSAPGVEGAEGSGMALSTDGSGRWCSVDPRAGAAMVVAEAALNVACVGGRPAALVNCLNLGSPENPEVMWQLSEVVDGIAEACEALSIPVVGGNVSLYNASAGRDIDPTPVVGVLGLVERIERRPPGMGLQAGATVMLLGRPNGELGGSRWAVELRNHRGGRLPALDLVAHAALVQLVGGLVGKVLRGEDRYPDGAASGQGAALVGVHDVSDGGLGVALAEMAAASGTGVVVEGVEDHRRLFSEAASRVLVCTWRPEVVEEEAARSGVPTSRIGTAGSDRLVIEGLVDLAVSDLVAARASAIAGRMGVPVGTA